MNNQIMRDRGKLVAYLERRIRRYPKYENLGPGRDEDPVALLTVGYYPAQTGYVAVVFDTRPDADSDGEWTRHIDNGENILRFPHWPKAFAAHPASEMVLRVGEMIRDAIVELRDRGGFRSLPLRPDAFFVVEEFDGAWGWPPYEERRRLGRLRSG